MHHSIRTRRIDQNDTTLYYAMLSGRYYVQISNISREAPAHPTAKTQ